MKVVFSGYSRKNVLTNNQWFWDNRNRSSVRQVAGDFGGVSGACSSGDFFEGKRTMAKQIEEDFYEEFQLEHVKKQPKHERHGRCEKCLYWQPLKNGFPPGENNVRGRKGDNIGECRFSAPGVGNLDVLWPVTYEFDWCGQFRAKAGAGGLAAI